MESGWLVANALLTNEERCRRHLTVDSARVRYGESHENRDHVLRNCGLATKVRASMDAIRNCSVQGSNLVADISGFRGLPVLEMLLH
ncbi:uncharacterized protein LOC109813196 isoform X2 [Cajanus cajan]|uniref:uncharacterized protein LOC109813196 isoform X2 n=1 Tax=Cajanus cajan TaxID=3821 RepID=UPI00098DAD0B|nr:uncharacterized protein LOC109813196 isoform X2 [Cajanus cajan]